jgi:hypothetical protein
VVLGHEAVALTSLEGCEMNGKSEKPEDRRPVGPVTEFEEVLGAFDAAALDIELRKLAGGPSRESVELGEVAALLTAYREARVRADELRMVLVGAGLENDELPELCGTVDEHGRAVVMLGAVAMTTATRLVRLVGGQPLPPRDEGGRHAA